MPTTSCSWAQAPDLSQNEDVAELYVYSLDSQNSHAALSYDWGSATGTDFDDLADREDEELLTDARPDDRIVILRNKHCRRYSRSRSNYNETFAELFSVPVDDGTDLFRCSQTDLPDLIEWITFQQSESYTLYQQPFFAVLEDPEAVTSEEINRCSLAISQLLQSRSVTDLQLSLLACYIVANSYRELNPGELSTAVYELAKTRLPRDSQFMREERGMFRQHILLQLLRTILRMKKNLRVSFNEPSMRRFLQTVSLPGVERGHGTMAQLCLGEIRRFGDALIVQPWHKFRKWFGSCSEWPLMKYATKYWSCHVREASPTRPDVTAHLFHIINQGVADKSPSYTPVHLQQRVVEIGYSVSKLYDLPCLTSLYENLGASGDSSLLKLPMNTEFKNLELASYHSLQSIKDRDTTPEVTDNLPAHSRTLQSALTEIIPEFDMIQISSKGQHEASAKPTTTSEPLSEDLDWEYVNRAENCHSIDQAKRNSANSWNIVSQEDCDM